MSTETVPHLLAPVAARLIDLEDCTDLDLRRDGAPYRSAMLVARRAGRPIGTAVVMLDDEQVIDYGVLESLFPADDSNLISAHDESPSTVVTSLPTVSAIVTTCASADTVIMTVESILACDPPPLEVIVVDNRPENSPVPAAIEQRYGRDPRVRCVCESRVGLSAARNAGLNVARGDITAYTDDDILVDPGWIGWTARAYASEPSAACVTGLIIARDLEQPSQVLVEQFAGFGKGLERQVHRLDTPTSVLSPYAAGEFGSGACTSLRTNFAREIGGFDTDLGAGTIARGAEDLDMYLRVLTAGRSIVYEPAAIVWHQHRDSPDEMLHKAFDYGMSLTAMLTKHMLNGHAREITRRLPAALRFLLDPESRKNLRKTPEYPRRFDWLERAGMCCGPIAYLLSHRHERRVEKQATLSEPFDAMWVTQLDLGDASDQIVVPQRTDGANFTLARVLVRENGAPVGLVTVPVQNGVVELHTVQTALSSVDSVDEQARGPVRLDRELPPMGVVICTHERPESLRRALGSILDAAGSNTEVLVVDSAPQTDRTARVVEALADPRLRLVTESLAGLARARNRGLQEIDRDLVAFTDDDVMVDREWLAALADGFERSGQVACVTGIVPAAELETASQAIFEDRVKWSDALHPRLFDLDEHRGEGWLFPFTAGDIGAGANFAVCRSKIAGLRFDEALGAGTPARGGEDLDFFARTLLDGSVIAFEPAAIVWHFHRRDASSLKTQMYGYGSGLTAYAFKHIVNGSVLHRLVGQVRRRGTSPRARADRKGPQYNFEGPSGLRRNELRGMLAGPGLYLQGRARISSDYDAISEKNAQS